MLKGPGRRRWGLILSLVVLAAALAGCSTSDLPQSVFDPKGPVAREQLGILSLTMWMALGVFLVVCAAWFYIVFRFREKKTQSAPAQIHGNHTLEVIWTAIPILILAIIAVPTVRYYTSGATQAAAGEETLRVKATGYQWWFSFEYPQENITTGNELVIPVGKWVHLDLEAKDVIHSFWVPKLAGKVDMIPGRVNQLQIKAEETGIFWGQCAEYCGSSHAKMRFRVVVKSQEEYDRWVAARQAHANVIPPEGTLEHKGYMIFMGQTDPKRVCFSCHAIDGTDAQGVAGPNLTNLGERTTIAAGVLDHTPDNLKAWLRNPPAIKPGSKMPNFGLSEEEIEALAAYLQSLK